jgi:glutamate synthase (ferredoxin)
MDNRSIKENQHRNSSNQGDMPYPGQRWLVEERDACGVGFIASQAGTATHELIEQALSALGCLEHRGGLGTVLV